MTTDFIYLLRVRYAECDAQNVVFNGRYVEYADVAATEFLRSIWGNYSEILARGLDSQVVKLTIDWQAPAHFDEVLAIQVKCSHIGNTSYHLQFQFSDHNTGKAIATAQIIYVMVSAKEHVKTTIPEDLREKLEEGAPSIIIDHGQVATQSI